MSSFYPKTDLTLKKQKCTYLTFMALTLAISFMVFTSASAQKTPTKAQIANTQRQKEGQDLINKLNNKLQATRSAQANKASIAAKSTVPILKASTQNVIPKSKQASRPNLISSTPPKPVTSRNLITPPSKRIVGTSPSARAAQIGPQSAANKLNPGTRAAQLNPANKIPKPAAAKAANKKAIPLRDKKFKRDQYKAKRNNG